MNRFLSAAAIAACLAGCGFGYVSNFSFPQTQCRFQNSWCIIELPAVGFLGVGAGASSGSIDETMLSFRLSPRDGVTVAWTSAEFALVDLRNNKSIQVKALDTRQVTGRWLYPRIAEENWVLYGPYSTAEFRLTPRITKMEVRFPPLLVDGKTVQVPPVRIDDGTRTPKVMFYYSH
jgi:hypothetical protein